VHKVGNKTESTVFVKVWPTSPQTARTTGNEDAIIAAVEVHTVSRENRN